ncbi:MAG: GNAT family N-acetyltransferase [Lentimicrobiaceae bacterium]|nr:GNAT family N-acetyltransferase [Lentimicrobiaceae bacterium]
MIETERLILRPLTYEQLIKYAKCDNSLELELRLNKSARSVSAELQEALEQTIIPNVRDKSKNYLYSTIWTAIYKTENRMVGDLCIYGEPNAEGEIEIGYGTYEEFQNQGFMTEMVKGLVDWAYMQPKVKSIMASTDKTNTASFRVLEKNHFVRTGESGNLYHYKLELNR